MTLKDLKMAAMACALANKDSKEGMTAPDNEEGGQQEGVVDQDSEKEKTNQDSDEGISNQESEEGDSNEAMSESDAYSESENETLANLIAVKDQEGEDSWWDDSSDDERCSVYHDGSKPLTGDEDMCLSAWSDDSYGIRDTFTSDKDDDGVTPVCGKSFKKGELKFN